LREQIIVSFSGGRTSGYMSHWLQENMSHLYDFIFVYSNTGLEHENTLKFVDQCDKHFNMNLVWVEAVVSRDKGQGTKHKIVDFKTASRKGEPMEDVIKKYGLPNGTYIHCTRETKLQVIKSYQSSIGHESARNAVGIRYDEFHRVKNNKALIYPLATITKVSKKDVIDFWSNMAFDLMLDEHYGNCVGCYKKSDKKLKMLADDKSECFDFWIDMENKYSNVITPKETYKRTIYRGYRTAYQVKHNLNMPDKLTESDECAEECGTVANDYVPEIANNVLFI